ncbi:MAG: tetratricopeptide repeat protein [Bryobacteraceae bacterium]
MLPVLVLWLAAAGILAAQDPLKSEGFQHFYNLEYDQAIAAFENQIAANPDSPDLHNHLAQAIQFREMFRVGALESELVSGSNSFLRRPKIDTTPATEKRFFAEVDKAIGMAQARVDKNPNDAAALYSLGVSYGLRANWNFLVRKAWRDALREATTARKMHNRVSELDPSNIDAKLVQGAHDYVVGSLPTLYKMLGFLAGYRGDRDKGIRMLREVAEKGRYNRIDAEVFLCALYRREQRWHEASPLLEDLVRRFPRNYLLRFEQAQMFGAIGKKDQALDTLRKVAELTASRAPGFTALPIEKVHYQMGNIYFWYRDFDKAIDSLKKATANASVLDLNTGALAYLRMGQTYDLTNRRELAQAAYKKAIEFAPEADASKEAHKYLSSPYRRT